MLFWEEITFSTYQSKFFAHELTKRCPPGSVERLADAVASAQVDLNPPKDSDKFQN